jgi:hypothetical protein
MCEEDVCCHKLWTKDRIHLFMVKKIFIVTRIIFSFLRTLLCLKSEGSLLKEGTRSLIFDRSSSKRDQNEIFFKLLLATCFSGTALRKLLPLHCTASKNPATTSGASHYPRLAPLPPTTLYDTNSTQNWPYTPRPNSDPQRTKPFITRWLKDGSPINHIAQPRPSDTSPRPVPASGLQNH